MTTNGQSEGRHAIRSLSFSNFDQALNSEARVEDLADLTFIDAYGLVGLTITLIDAQRRNEEFTIALPKNDGTWLHLVRMGFRNALDEAGLDYELPEEKVIERPDVLVPLQFLRSTKDVIALSELLWEQLRHDADSQVLEAMSEGLWELAANAIEHSGEPAIAMGQVYTRGQAPDHDHTVQITIGDTGRGIRDSFLESGRYRPDSDREALDLALQYLVSSVDDPGRGQGLATTREQTVGLQGAFSIRSGAARLIDRAGTAAMTDVPHLPGTMVGLVIPLRPGTNP
jgi:hypothetical protein